MATRRLLEIQQGRVYTDEAHYENVIKCDFCKVKLGADYDAGADYAQETICYFKTQNDNDDWVVICQECAETLSMYAEDRHYKEPVVKWKGQLGTLPARRIEDLPRDELVEMVRYLNTQLKD